MVKGFKMKLYLNKSQRHFLYNYFKLIKDVYNDNLKILKDFYKKTNSLIKPSVLRENFNEFSKSESLKIYPVKSLESVVNKAYLDFKKYLDTQKGEPKFRSILFNKSSIALSLDEFYVKNDKVYFNSYIESNPKTNHGIKIKERGRFPCNKRMINPHLSFDGIDYYISASFNIENTIVKSNVHKVFSLGIDVGVLNWFTFSNGMTFENINKSKRMYRLERKARTIQKKKDISKLLSQRWGKPLSNNFFKLNTRYIKIKRRMSRIRIYHIYQVVKAIIKLNPVYVCIEDLKVTSMVHDSELSRYIFEACFRQFRTILNYKMKDYGIKVITADKYYPSSKLCSRCNNLLPSLELNERTYLCPKCGLKIDRDLNAAINLAKLADKFKYQSTMSNVDFKTSLAK